MVPRTRTVSCALAEANMASVKAAAHSPRRIAFCIYSSPILTSVALELPGSASPETILHGILVELRACRHARAASGLGSAAVRPASGAGYLPALPAPLRTERRRRM